MTTYRVEVFKTYDDDTPSEWVPFSVDLKAVDANFTAGLIARNSNMLQRTVNEQTGESTHGRVKES